MSHARLMQQSNGSDVWMVVLTAVIAIATALYCGVSVWLALEARWNRHALLTPCVLITVERSERIDDIFQFVIQNVGGGVAKEIAFEMIGLDLSNPKLGPNGSYVFEALQKGALKSGLPLLGPGRRHCVEWGLGFDIWPHFSELLFVVRATYKGPQGKPIVTESAISLSPYEGTRFAPKDPAQELHKLNDCVQRLARTLEGLHREVPSQSHFPLNGSPMSTKATTRTTSSQPGERS